MQERNNIKEIIQRNFMSKISYFSKYNSRVKVFENTDFIRVDSGMPSDTFNICVVKDGLSLEKEGILEDNADYFNKKAYPAAFWIWDEINSDKERELEKNGFGLAEKETGMYIDLDKIVFKENNNNNFIIKKVISDKDMEDFSEVLGSVFGATAEASYVKEQYKILGEEKIYNSSAMSFYTGFYNEEPVSCGALFISEESSGIYEVATKEKYRKMGFGSAVFGHLLGTAKETGRKYCILQASADGAGIYKKMGFMEICNINVYENRAFLEKSK
jgi:ribosomal protein S18 acetylase RimI-like enzyme